MIESKPVNVYCRSLESGYESPVSGESSRKNSIGLKEYVRSRRYTMLSRPNRVSIPMPAEVRQNGSTDSSLGDTVEDVEEEDGRPLYRRRMSVPEKVFLSAEYAICRPVKQTDVKFEIVAAFDRNTDPYRHYMQSLTCYDLQPNHGAVIVIDSNLKIHKALTALSQCGHQAAVVMNIPSEGGIGILTITDCLRAIVLASEGVHRVADQTVAQFLQYTHRKSLISADAKMSVWDAARLVVSNGIHRVPVVDTEGSTNGDLLYILSLKMVFTETVLKLSDAKFSLGPHVNNTNLSQRKLGTWNDIITVSETSKCQDVVKLYLDRKVSCVPVVDGMGRVVGVVGKTDLMTELVSHPNNYLELLDLPIMKIVEKCSRPVLGKTTMSVYEAISALCLSDKQALVVVDVENRPMGVVSYSDIMDYIQHSSDVNHKFSLA